MPPRLDEEPSLGFRFAATDLDRRADLRDDADAIDRLFAAASTRVFALAGPRAIVARPSEDVACAAHDAATATRLVGDDAERVFLGLAGDVAWFALAAPTAEPELPEGFEAVDLRALAVAGSLPAEQYGGLATARSLHAWHYGHAHCARCGAATAAVSAGWRRLCPACGAEHFPRTDPVVIMMIEREGRGLLGRAKHFPEGMWSCLAGFVEPGETVEAAARREVLEEAGIVVGRLAYVASEPWPFPGSLMIGLHGEAESETITVDPAEMDDCRWFDRDEVRMLLERTHPDGLFAPPPIAIAHHLMRRFAFPA